MRREVSSYGLSKEIQQVLSMSSESISVPGLTSCDILSYPETAQDKAVADVSKFLISLYFLSLIRCNG